jgi:hypothetical protein
MAPIPGPDRRAPQPLGVPSRHDVQFHVQVIPRLSAQSSSQGHARPSAEPQFFTVGGKLLNEEALMQ